jgi:hypothetical protein
MNANRIGIWTIERANAHDLYEQAINGTNFPWYLCGTLPNGWAVRFPCTSVQQARELAVCRSIEHDGA